jgi:flagellar hook protein FlgE
MSLFGVMRTGVSGMAGQATKMSTIADNIANAQTTGYKRGSTEFESMIEQIGADLYTTGGVETHTRYAVSEQGGLARTTAITDLAINGDGFFVVNDGSDRPFLTRAGAFVPDAEGQLVNAAGYYLMGYDLRNGEAGGVANGFAGLTKVRIEQQALQATASTEGHITANLPSEAAIVAAASLPSANDAAAAHSAKTSLASYDNLGKEVILDVYMTKSGANSWEVAIFDRTQAAAGGGFPYASGPLATETLTFDATNGNLAAASPTAITATVPNGQDVTLDLSGMTQLAADYTLVDAEVNGNAPSEIDRIEIGQDGIVSSIFKNGTRLATFQIPLGEVTSPENLTLLNGNVYAANEKSGAVNIGAAQEGGLGTIYSAALEQSTVDLAGELTSMIESQRAFSANSKSFQTGSDLLEVLMNLRS